jgi:hypothetical protein
MAAIPLMFADSFHSIQVTTSVLIKFSTNSQHFVLCKKLLLILTSVFLAQVEYTNGNAHASIPIPIGSSVATPAQHLVFQIFRKLSLDVISR